MTQHIQAIVTVLSLVNPLICAAIFNQVARGKSTDKIAAATKAMLAVAVILCLAALGGAQLLKAFGISLSAFQVAGGLVLSWMGFIMLRGDSSPTSASDSATAGAQPSSDSLTQLVLFAASPGTITGVITLAVSHAPGAIPVTALVAIGVTCAITWAIMLLASKGSATRKQGLVHDVASRFMGLIVLSMGVQFALSGLHEFFQSG